MDFKFLILNGAKKEGGSSLDKVPLVRSGHFTRPFLILFGIFAKPFRYAASALTPADLLTSCVRLVSWTHSSVPTSHCGTCAPRKPSTVYRNGTPGKACIRNRETESRLGGIGKVTDAPAGVRVHHERCPYPITFNSSVSNSLYHIFSKMQVQF